MITAAIVTLVSLIALGCIRAYRKDKSLWNSGVCARCGTAWTHFDNDSQGGRGYSCQCPLADRYVWIGWPVDNHLPVPISIDQR